MSLAEPLSSFLEANGIQYVYGVPGEGILEILDGLEDGPVHFVATRQLWAAGYAAMGEAWVKRRPAVCMYGAGTYAAELTRPALDAQRNAIPMIFLGPGPGFEDVKVVKATLYATLENLPEILRNAFELAREEPPGPVSIVLSLEKPAPSRIARTHDQAEEVPDIPALAELLLRSQRPLIVAGSRVSWEGAEGKLAGLSRNMRIPVTPTLGALGVMPDDEMNRPVCGLQDGDPELTGLEDSDLVLSVGVRRGELPSSWLQSDTARPVYHVTPEHLASLLTHLREGDRERGRDVSGARELREMRERLLEAKSFPPNPVQVLEAVRAVLDDGDLVIVDAGLARLWAGRFLKVPSPRTVFIPPTGVAPGFGFTASLGARLARPEGRVLVLCGDAAFLAACPEVETHRRLGSHVLTVVVRDSRLGWIGHRQEQEFGRRSFVGFRLPNIIRLSKVLGGTGSRLEKGDRLETLLREGFAASGAVVVDCPVDTRDTGVLTETWGRPFAGN